MQLMVAKLVHDLCILVTGDDICIISKNSTLDPEPV